MASFKEKLNKSLKRNVNIFIINALYNSNIKTVLCTEVFYVIRQFRISIGRKIIALANIQTVIACAQGFEHS